MPGAPWPKWSRPADELEGALTSAHELEAHLGQLGEGPARPHELEGKARVLHLGGARTLATTALIVAASVHRAMWPLTGSSVQWKTGVAPGSSW